MWDMMDLMFKGRSKSHTYYLRRPEGTLGDLRGPEGTGGDLRGP